MATKPAAVEAPASRAARCSPIAAISARLEQVLERLGHRRIALSHARSAGLASACGSATMRAARRLNRARRRPTEQGHARRMPCSEPSRACRSCCVPLPRAAAAAAPWRLDPGPRIAVDVGWQGATVEVRFTRLSRRRSSSTSAGPERRGRASPSRPRRRRPASGVVDALVRSRDYLDAERSPEIVFDLDRLVRTSKETADVVRRHHHARRDAAGSPSRRGCSATGRPRTRRSASRRGSTSTGEIDRTEFGSTGGLPEVAAGAAACASAW